MSCPHCGEELIKDISDDWLVKLSNGFIKWHNYYKNQGLYKFSSVTIGSMIELEEKENNSTLSRIELFDVFKKYLNKENAELYFNLLKKSDIFKKKLPIIDDAIEAHFLSKYTLSIPTLFPVIEGVLREIQNLSPSDNFKCSLDYETLQNRGLFMIADSVEYFNKFVYKLFEGQADPSVFNRNPILHGITSEYYSEEHSLILILTIFEIDIIYRWINKENMDISHIF